MSEPSDKKSKVILGIVLELAESTALAVAVKPVAIGLRETTKHVAKALKRPIQETPRF